jgi:hypothetical protein
MWRRLRAFYMPCFHIKGELTNGCDANEYPPTPPISNATYSVRMFNHNKFQKTDNSKQGCQVEQRHCSDVHVEMENQMIDVTLVIDTLPDTPLLSTPSFGIPLMLFLPLAQTSTRQMIRDSEGSCYNNYMLFLRCDPNSGIMCCVL